MTPEYLLSEDFRRLQSGVEKLQSAWKGRQELHLTSLRSTVEEINNSATIAEDSGFEKVMPALIEYSEKLNAVCCEFTADKERITAALLEISEKHGYKP